MRRFWLLTAFTLLLSAPASAGLVHNLDGTAYELELEQANSKVVAKIRANTSVRIRCASLPCELTLKKTGQTLRLRDNDQQVRIEKGKLQLAK